MRARLTLAVWLGVIALCGCAQLPRDSIALAVDRQPAPRSWGSLFQRPSDGAGDAVGETARAARLSRSERQEAKDAGAAEKARTAPADSLDPETRRLLEEQLSGIESEEERARFLTYLSTVPPNRVGPLLQTLRRGTQEPAAAETPPLVHPLAATDPVPDSEPAEAAPDSRLALISHESAEPAAPPSEPAAEPTASEQPPVPAASTPPAASVPEAPAGGHAPVLSPFSRLRQWDPRRTLGLSWSEAEETDDVPAGAPASSSERLLSPLARITPRRLRSEATDTATAAVLNMVEVPAAPPPRPDPDETYLEEELHRLVSLMEARAERIEPGATFAQRDEYLRAHVFLRMLYLMDGEPQLAQQAIPRVDPGTQEFWTSTMWGLSSYFDSETTPDPSDRAALSLDQLRAAVQHLQPAARLELHGLAFCDRIDGFGVYHPFERALFRAGQPVLLYAEVRNFKTELSTAGLYRTALRSTIEIHRNGPEGELVERKQFDVTEDVSRSPRTDYFHNYKLDLPAHMTPGPHSLRLTLEDDLSGKIASATVDFLVR